MNIKDLKLCDIFSFAKKGAVHMVSAIKPNHIEYKSYEDGKIRTYLTDKSRAVFLRPDYEMKYEMKWFKP